MLVYRAMVFMMMGLGLGLGFIMVSCCVSVVLAFHAYLMLSKV